MSSPIDPTDDAIRLLEAFHTLVLAFKRWSRPVLEVEGGSLARMRLLGVLHCSGSRIMNELGEELGVTPRQVTNLVDALEAEGLVRRTPHATDRRATVIEITPPGVERVEEMFRPFQEQLAAPFRDLPAADRRELLRLLESLVAAVRRRSHEG
jgi:DNA-binding MarR family transcriptional regulator